ncbi:MAG: ABC transporter permease, partial [Vicinamibacterales bacterium]
MSLLRQITRGLRVLVRGSAADRELDEELRHFYDEAHADAIARGVPEEDARRESRLAFGDGTTVREQVRTHGWEHAIETVLADLRYALRGFRRRPGFAIVAALTLAVGIGASTAIFSAVDPILFEPLPYPHADRILAVSSRADGRPLDVAYGTYLEIAHRSRSFSFLAVADRWQPALTGRGAQPERLAGGLVTPDYFRVLGIEPMIGRDFTAADDVRGAPRVAIVSDGLARRHFGAAQVALGQFVELEGAEYTVIGIMPPVFDNVLMPADDVWAPRRYRSNAPFESAEWGHHQQMIGRLSPGVTVDQARSDLAAIAQSPSVAFPRPPWADMKKQGLEVRSLQAAVTRDVRPALLAIFAAVALVLLVAAVNVTNLLLARGAQRRGELALRVALGAGRGRIVRQLLTESLLLAFCGGVLGLAVATAGIRGLVALAPANLPRAAAIALDVPAFAFALAQTAIVGIAIGLYPALQGAGQDGGDSLQPGTRIAGASSNALRRTLVVAEIALALVLLVGAGLMVRSLARLMSIAPGFRPSGLLTMQIEAAGPAYNPDPARYQFFTQALDAVRRLPGVTSAAFTSQLPLGGEPNEGYGVRFQAQPPNDPNGDYNALRYA